jgi:hypothetical protein
MVTTIWQRFFLNLWQRTARFEGELVVPTSGTTVGLAHTLTQVPFGVAAWLLCDVADAGWEPGDLIQAPGYGGGYGVQLWADAFQVYVLVGEFGLELPDKSSGVSTLLTPANWTMVVRAQA